MSPWTQKRQQPETSAAMSSPCRHAGPCDPVWVGVHPLTRIASTLNATQLQFQAESFCYLPTYPHHHRNLAMNQNQWMLARLSQTAATVPLPRDCMCRPSYPCCMDNNSVRKLQHHCHIECPNVDLSTQIARTQQMKPLHLRKDGEVTCNQETQKTNIQRTV